MSSHDPDNPDIQFDDVVKGLGLTPALSQKIMDVFRPDEPTNELRLTAAFVQMIITLDEQLSDAGYHTPDDMQKRLVQALAKNPFTHPLLNNLLDDLSHGGSSHPPTADSARTDPLETLARLMQLSDKEVQPIPPAPPSDQPPAPQSWEPETVASNKTPIFGGKNMPLHMAMQLNKHLVFLDDSLESAYHIPLKDTEKVYRNILRKALDDFGYGKVSTGKMDLGTIYHSITLQIASDHMVQAYVATAFHEHAKDMTEAQLENLPAISTIPLISIEADMALIGKSLGLTQIRQPSPVINAVEYASTYSSADKSPYHQK